MDQGGILSRSSTALPGLPSPEHPEPVSLPTDDGLGLEDDQRNTPVWPPSLQDHPDFALQSGLVRPPMKHRDLVPKR